MVVRILACNGGHLAPSQTARTSRLPLHAMERQRRCVREDAALKNRFREAEQAGRPCASSTPWKRHAWRGNKNRSNVILLTNQLSRRGRDAFRRVSRNRAQFFAARNMCRSRPVLCGRRVHRADTRLRVHTHRHATQPERTVIGQKNPSRNREKHRRPSACHGHRTLAQHVFSSPIHPLCSSDFCFALTPQDGHCLQTPRVLSYALVHHQYRHHGRADEHRRSE